MTWKTKTLDELCKMYQPKTISKKQLKPNGKYFVYGANGIIGKHDKYNHKDSQLLLTCRGATCGSINTSKPFSWINGNAMVIQPNENEVSKKYIEYFLKGIIKFSKIITGSAQPQITRESLNPVLVSFPSLPEQQLITAKLEAVFVEIDRATATAEHNAENAEVLFEQFRNEIFSSLASSSTIKKLSDTANLSRGHNPPKSKFIYETRHGYVRFYQIRDAKSDKFATYVPDSPQLHKVNKDEFLMNAYRYVGEVYRGVEGAYNVALCKLSVKDDEVVNRDYLFYMIPSYLIKGELLKTSARSLIPSMSIKELAEIKIPIPSFFIQQQTVKKIIAISQECALLKTIYLNKVISFSDLKKALLKNLLKNNTKLPV